MSSPSHPPFWVDSGGPMAAPRLVWGTSSQGHLVGVTLGVYAGPALHWLRECDKAASFRLGGGGRSVVSPLPRAPLRPWTSSHGQTRS